YGISISTLYLRELLSSLSSFPVVLPHFWRMRRCNDATVCHNLDAIRIDFFSVPNDCMLILFVFELFYGIRIILPNTTGQLCMQCYYATKRFYQHAIESHWTYRYTVVF